MGILPFLFLFGAILATRAADPDVFPTESLVPQCSTLEVVWGQPPPLHLHVQPDSLINVTNLVDLGLQNGTSTNFQVNLPIGQNFTFVYNTIANQFTVFISNMMQVGPGTTDCLGTSASSSGQSSTSSSSGPSSSSSPSGSSVSVPPTASASSSSTALPTASSSTTKAFPVGAVVGSVCALAAVIFITSMIFCYKRTRSRTPLPNPESSATFAGPPSSMWISSTGFPSTVGYSEADMAQVPASGVAPYPGSQEHPKMQRFRHQNSSNTVLPTPTTETLSATSPSTMTSPTVTLTPTTAHSEIREEQPPPAYVG
ncbi:hypothetical protein K438DRAFT_1957338 [Mycena galopus ATCC 62051]|nr:hypothetical protein K438DRAFT_1957338 [Mycena galopus ATCC 62051]